MSEKLSDIGEAQTTKVSSQVSNEERNNEKSEAIEQQDAHPLTHVEASGDVIAPKKQKFEGFTTPTDVCMLEKLSDISMGEVQTTVYGSQDGNSEANNKKFKVVEQQHDQPLSHHKVGDESPLKKRKFEGLTILKDIVHTENKGVANRTRSHCKSKLVAKDRKIGTISRPIDSNDIIELDSIDCNDIIELESDKEEEANTGVTIGSQNKKKNLDSSKGDDTNFLF